MEDNMIVELYWNRSDAAIEETSKKYGRYCKVIAYNIVASDEDAEECVNDTYLGAWEAMPPQRPGRLQAFLGRITRNIALDKVDYRRAKKRSAELTLLLSELGDCLSARETVESTVEDRDIARAISAFLRSSKPEVRRVFLRRYWYADPVAEIARRFGMSESKVKSLLHRTRGRLRDYLSEEGITI